DLRFNMIHDKDGGRIHQKRVCSVDGEEVPWEHIVKGFEISKGRYVTVTKDELAAFNPKATRSIDIEDFVDLHQIDPIFYETTYYLLPDRGATRPYALLLEAMKKTGRVGVARFVLRTKQYLAAVRPMGRVLAISTMLYADEIVEQVDLEGVPGAEAKPREKELHMAEQLVDSLAADFDPKKYKDTFREQVLALLERKAEGEEIVAEPAEEQPRGKVVNLMDALAKILAAARKGEAPESGDRRHRPDEPRAAARTARARSRRGGAKAKGKRKHGRARATRARCASAPGSC